mgnify:CR=1 FL=1
MGYRFLSENRSKAGHCERVSERSLHFADNVIGSCQFVQQFHAVPNEGDPHTYRNAIYQLMDIPEEIVSDNMLFVDVQCLYFMLR